MAFVFALALLLDSACAAACVPVELSVPSKHCSSGDTGHERGCDLHAHLKPAIKSGSADASAPTNVAPATLDSPSTFLDLERAGSAFDRVSQLHLPPLIQRSPILRI